MSKAVMSACRASSGTWAAKSIDHLVRSRTSAAFIERFAGCPALAHKGDGTDR